MHQKEITFLQNRVSLYFDRFISLPISHSAAWAGKGINERMFFKYFTKLHWKIYISTKLLFVFIITVWFWGYLNLT